MNESIFDFDAQSADLWTSQAVAAGAKGLEDAVLPIYILAALQVHLSSSDSHERLAALQMKLADLYAKVERQTEAVSLLQSLCQRLNEADTEYLPAHCQLADVQVCFILLQKAN